MELHCFFFSGSNLYMAETFHVGTLAMRADICIISENLMAYM